MDWVPEPSPLFSVFRFLTRGLGTRKSASPDILSLIMFQEDYLRRLIALGESDAAHNHARIAAFIEGDVWGTGTAASALRRP